MHISRNILSKHVLLVVQNNSFPTDKRVAKEARSLKEAGYDVSVISPAFGSDSAGRNQWNGIDIYRYRHFEASGGLPGFVLEYANALIRIFSIALGLFVRKPFKSIHVANPPDFFWPMALFFKLFRVKFIFDQHDISAEMYRVNEGKEKNSIYGFLNWNEKMTACCADGIITTNYSIRDRLQSLYGYKQKPYEVVYNGPSQDFAPQDDPKLESEYSGMSIVLYVGEIAVMDSVEIVIDLARKYVLEEGRNDCKFILLGDGPDCSRLKAKTASLGLSEHVEFKGMVSHETVMKYLAIASVCLVPDEVNGLNEYLTLVKSLEYLKAGVPFVAFDLKETRSIAADNALFADDFEQYYQHVQHLLDNPDEAVKMGLIGKKRIESQFLWETQVPHLLNLYEDVLLGRQR